MSKYSFDCRVRRAEQEIELSNAKVVIAQHVQEKMRLQEEIEKLTKPIEIKVKKDGKTLTSFTVQSYEEIKKALFEELMEKEALEVKVSSVLEIHNKIIKDCQYIYKVGSCEECCDKGCCEEYELSEALK